MRLLVLLFCLFCSVGIIAQEVIDGSFSFQDEDKKYSIYVPSTYDPNVAQDLMIGFHPFNTSRWDSESWRDTLIQFAENNSLILACPDGGIDGRVDDPIDTAFTTALLDTLGNWYNINRDRQYAIGFSWGARTAYSYSMNHPGVFQGVIPVGAAIDGTAQFNTVISNAPLMDFYIIHGSNDSPNTRYFPVLAAFEQNEVCHMTQLLSGVGHTIDFPSRNEILNEAFAFVSADNNCLTNAISSSQKISSIEIFPNPIAHGKINVQNNEDLQVAEFRLFDLQGKLIYQWEGNNNVLRTKQDLLGAYILSILHKNGFSEKRKLIFGD